MHVVKELFKNIANEFKSEYIYGRSDIQNLETLNNALIEKYNSGTQELIIYCNTLNSNEQTRVNRIELIIGKIVPYSHDFELKYNDVWKCRMYLREIVDYLDVLNVNVISQQEILNDKDMNIDGVYCQFDIELPIDEEKLHKCLIFKRC